MGEHSALEKGDKRQSFLNRHSMNSISASSLEGNEENEQSEIIHTGLTYL